MPLPAALAKKSFEIPIGRFPAFKTRPRWKLKIVPFTKDITRNKSIYSKLIKLYFLVGGWVGGSRWAN